jgi:putative ATP-dependent endonuclease of OLD family
MATLQIAAAAETETKINLIDEVERGLELYRTRKLVKSLQLDHSQTFLTTHSPTAIAAADESSIWYVDAKKSIGLLEGKAVQRFQREDPETFLSRLTIVCEGATEVGFVKELLSRALEGDLEDYGIHFTDAVGNEAACRLMKATSAAGLAFACFVDNDDNSPTIWFDIQQRLGPLFFQWDSSTEKAVVGSVSEKRLPDLIRNDDGGFDGERLRSLADRLDLPDKQFESISEALEQRKKDLRELIIEASTGETNSATDESKKKDWKKHGQRWFKSVSGGGELARKMFTLDCWPTLKPALLPFVNAVLTTVGQNPIDDLS